MSSCTPTDSTNHQYFLMFSNITYFIPIITALFMYKHGKMEKGLTIQIVLLVSGIIIISWIFHSCRNEVTRISDPCQENKLDPDTCDMCQKNFKSMNVVDTNIKVTSFGDHFLSQFAIILIISYILPLKSHIKIAIQCVSLTYILVALISNVSRSLEFIPGFIILILIFIPIIMFNIKYHTKNQLLCILLLIFIGILSFYIFIIDQRKYWFYHSLWHIFGAISATIVIMLGKSFYKLDNNDFGNKFYHSFCDISLLNEKPS